MINHGVEPFLECSSAGDSRFSALHARVSRRGNLTIEQIYQAAKVFEDGSTGLSWRKAKGRKAVNAAETRALYSTLWDEYIEENRHLILVLQRATGVSDRYGQAGHACQATELWRIRAESLGLRSLL